MKKLSRWLILAIAIFLCLAFAKVVFSADIPRETIRCIRCLARDNYKSFAEFCADTVLFGPAFGSGIWISKKKLIHYLKKEGLSDSARVSIQKFPIGFEINWDRKKGELVCYRFCQPLACLVFRQEKGIWRLTVLGIHFSKKGAK